MTPAARVAAAIDCLDRIFAGEAAEKVLTNWARRSRFAGSGDRRGVRNLVFDGLRRRRSCGWTGGGDSGRAVMLGALRLDGGDPTTIFTGDGYAPSPLDPGESVAASDIDAAPGPVRHDVTDWFWEAMVQKHAPEFPDALMALRDRADVFLRVNLLKSDVEAAQRSLTAESIEAVRHGLSPSALRVTSNAQKLSASRAYVDGLVELQDAASQAVVDHIADLVRGATVLDFCAGGGGKSLAMAAHGARRVAAFDANPARMSDIPRRAARAGTEIAVLDTPETLYDLVFCDCPCSGSGAWRRQPEAKWRLGAEDLAELNETQDEILDRAADHVSPDGHLVYATCSILRAENADRISAFLARNPSWGEVSRREISPLEGADGFFVAVLNRAN